MPKNVVSIQNATRRPLPIGKMRLSIVIPAFNEEHRLGHMLDAYVPYVRARHPGDTELIVVVNGSVDGTESLARRYASQEAAVRVVVEPRPIGKGGAVMLGVDHARGDWIGFVDADGATPPEAFQLLLDAAAADGAAGIWIANRWDPRSRIRPQPWTRRAASRMFNALVRALFRIPVADTQCGAKLLRRDVAAAVRPKIGVTRWAFDVDLLFQVRRAGFAIREVPTIWSDQPGSRVRLVRASLEMFVALVRLRLLYSPFRWVVSVYDVTLGPWIHRQRPAPPAAGGAGG